MVRAGQAGVLFDRFREKKLVAISFAVRKRLTDVPNDQDAFGETYRDFDNRRIRRPQRNRRDSAEATQLRRFLYDIRRGDGVVTYSRRLRTYLIGNVRNDPAGDYYYDERSSLLQGTDYVHVRQVDWTAEVHRGNLLPGTRRNLSRPLSVFEVSNPAQKELVSRVKGDRIS